MALISRLWTRILKIPNSTEAYICSFFFSLLSRQRRRINPKIYWHEDRVFLLSTSLTQKLDIWIHQILDEPRKPRIKAMPSLSMPALFSTTKGGIPKSKWSKDPWCLSSAGSTHINSIFKSSKIHRCRLMSAPLLVLTEPQPPHQGDAITEHLNSPLS